MKEYFGYSLYSFYDMEKDLVDSKVMIMIALNIMMMVMMMMMMMMMTSMMMMMMICIFIITRCDWSSLTVD